jgi:hypothetical protein
MKAIAAYAAERLPVGLFVPAIVLLAASAWWVSSAPATALPGAIWVTALLFVQFRLWDDLEDVDHDRIAHANRVLIHVDRRIFWLLLTALVATTTAQLAPGRTAVSVFVLLLLAFATGYRVIRLWLSDAQWRYGLLLLKYPAFICVVATRIGEPAGARLAAGAVAAYVTAATYEFWHHDRHSRKRSPTAPNLEAIS